MSLQEKHQSVTLKDLDIRYANIRKQFPEIENCSVKDCVNPVDITEGMGKDTTCSYHRMLFDHWIYEVVVNPLKIATMPKEERRSQFENFLSKLGKAKCDEIVLHMIQEPINWMC